MNNVIRIGEMTEYGIKEIEVRLLDNKAIQIRPWDNHIFELINDWELFEALEDYFEFGDNFEVELESEDAFYVLEKRNDNILLYTQEFEYNLTDEDLYAIYEMLEKAYYYAD